MGPKSLSLVFSNLPAGTPGYAMLGMKRTPPEGGAFLLGWRTTYRTLPRIASRRFSQLTKALD
jgi:hypothetical protein